MKDAVPTPETRINTVDGTVNGRYQMIHTGNGYDSHLLVPVVPPEISTR